jgi:hypothetical protein
MKSRIRKEAAENAVRRRLSFRNQAFNDPSGPREDYYEPPGANQRNQRTVKQLLFMVGPLVKGEKITVEYQDDGTACIYMNSPAANSVGEIPDGAYGDRFHPGKATGDDEMPNANERMDIHQIDLNGRPDKLLVAINGMNAQQSNNIVGSNDMPKNRTTQPSVGDDLMNPPKRSQSDTEDQFGARAAHFRSGNRMTGDDPTMSPMPTPRPTSTQLSLPGARTTKHFRYRNGSTAAKLHQINEMHRLYYNR